MKSADNTPFGRLVLGAPGDETTKHKPLTGERSLRILVVDDSEDDVMLLRHELLGHGIRFEYLRVDADSPMREALADDDWDIVICDHNMPGFDSLGALDVLKNSGKDIPFILYSGHICDEQAFMAMNQGVADYVPKGNIARLVPVIERELRGAAMREAVRVADDRIKELAFYDSLCALPNHNLFCARVSEWLLETERRGRIAKGALFYIDVDRFLRINSSFGYETGNELLRQVCGRRCSDPAWRRARRGRRCRCGRGPGGRPRSCRPSAWRAARTSSCVDRGSWCRSGGRRTRGSRRSAPGARDATAGSGDRARRAGPGS